MDEILDANEALETWLLLNRTRDTINKARQQELSQYGITPENSAVLHIVEDLGGNARPVEIAKWTSRKLHSVHGLLERMEQSGLIIKSKDPNRKNGVQISLTEQGRKLRRKTSELSMPRKIMSSLKKNELALFRKFLFSLLESAREEIGEEGEILMRPPTIKNNK